ncbi:P-loop containing nucleoside triphosphate hydrolase protein [Mycena crocata]|nr:P-loop containing nucleoside triphosphate hydrolase protein [Mycena crocata]
MIMKEELNTWLNTSKVFSSMTVFKFDLLEGHLHTIFWSLSEAITGKVSLDRVNAFLHEIFATVPNRTELLDSFTAKSPSASTTHVLSADVRAGGKIGFSDAVFAWSREETDGTETPSRSRFTQGRGCINLAVGPTGSGKTSPLMALLGEMHFIPSEPTSWFNLPRANGISYAAQESWVQNETIKRDLELFEAGDATEVGEKDCPSPSNALQARITLARAIYANAEIVLLDDVLAALDVHTAKWIVDKCLRGDLIAGRTIIMVTHNVAMTQPIAKYIISMGSNGRIHNHGPISEALATDEVLADELDQDQQVLPDKKLDEVGPPAAPTDKLIVAEEIEEGHVGWDSLKLYLKGMGGNHTILFFALFLGDLGLISLFQAVQTWFLGYWAGMRALILIGLCVYAVSFIYYTLGAFRASRVIHKHLVESVLGTTLRWLDVTPTSRVIARCTVDIRSSNHNASKLLPEMSTAMLVKFGAVVLFTPPFLLPGVLVGCLGHWIMVTDKHQQMYMAAQLSVKREMSNAKAPVLAHFGAVMTGLTSIRAYGAQNSAIDISLRRIDKYTRYEYRWFSGHALTLVRTAQMF